MRAAWILLPIVCGCGGSARLVLESPVAERCTSAGLDACPQLTEGVMLYMEGKPEAARPKLEEAAGANSPEKIREFSDGLQMLQRIPGAGSYVGPLAEIAAMLSSPKKQEPAPKAVQAKSVVARVPESVPVVNLDDEPLPVKAPAKTVEGGTVVPAYENGGQACQVASFLATVPSTSGVCAVAAQGPITVTDLHVSGDCPSDLYVLGSAATGPRWAVRVPGKNPLRVSGARLGVRTGETLTVATPAAAKADPRCAVTWSGEAP